METEIKFYIAVIVALIFTLIIALYTTRVIKKKPFCKYDGTKLNKTGNGSLHCPHCKRYYYKVNGKILEKF